MKFEISLLLLVGLAHSLEYSEADMFNINNFINADVVLDSSIGFLKSLFLQSQNNGVVVQDCASDVSGIFTYDKNLTTVTPNPPQRGGTITNVYVGKMENSAYITKMTMST